MNTFGKIFRFTSFGESHGPAIGGVIDGFPAGFAVDMDYIRHQLDRRRPGQSAVTTQRREADSVQFLSGIFDGVTTGAPIGFIIPNTSARPEDYEELCDVFRPSHADYTWHAKYGLRDHRGGGRSSARETAVRVVVGALARQALARKGVTVTAYTSRIGNVGISGRYLDVDERDVDTNPVRCPDALAAAEMERLLMALKADGDTTGGVVECVIKGVPPGLGEPVAGKLHAMLGAAMLSINACKGVEFGMGFDGAAKRGSDVVDHFVTGRDGRLTTATNHSGGIQGGISNGMDITLRVAFKPVATLMRETETVTVDGRTTLIKPTGRHDPCVVPRAVPVVEAMAACVLLDAMLLNKCARL